MENNITTKEFLLQHIWKSWYDAEIGRLSNQWLWWDFSYKKWEKYTYFFQYSGATEMEYVWKAFNQMVEKYLEDSIDFKYDEAFKIILKP